MGQSDKKISENTIAIVTIILKYKNSSNTIVIATIITIFVIIPIIATVTIVTIIGSMFCQTVLFRPACHYRYGVKELFRI